MFFETITMNLTEEIEKLVRPDLEGQQYELVETQYRKESGRWVLRLFIDRMQGHGLSGTGTGENPGEKNKISLADCEKVSELVGTLLDSSDLLSSTYVLEVSSPGINRRLKNESHFSRFIGEKVKISLYGPLLRESQQKNFSGVLLSCERGMVEVEDIVSGRVQIPLNVIAKAHLDAI